MTGHGQHRQVIIDGDRIGALDDALDAARVGANIVAMKNSLAAKVLAKVLVIGDVVLMGEKHRLYPAELLEATHQRPGEAR